MNSTHNTAIRTHNFSQAFEQMCSVVAIADTNNSEDTLRQLILQCFVVYPERRFHNSEQITDDIRTVFGLEVPQHQLDAVFLRMAREGSVEYYDNSYYTLPAKIRAELQARIQEATALEEKVKGEWLLEMAGSRPALDGNQLWIALKDYLAKAFGRHGLLTAALIDSAIDVTAEQDTSLNALLSDVVSVLFSPDQQIDARAAISDFLISVVDRQDRATYIAQLADGAFNYFSLTIAPDVSERLREHLSSLTLFLDTNFLLGVLDLHAHPLVEISQQLLRDIDKHKLPFKLRYHQITKEEMAATLGHYGRRLRAREWTSALSKVVLAQITTISGIERKYHQMNAEQKISVDVFLQPYARHSDVLLQEKNIHIYRSRLVADEVEKLCYDYREFVNRRGNNKEHKEDTSIWHDMILLDTVRQLRVNSESSLQAGALLLTCDTMLCRFDWATSRSRNRPVCTILPDMLWQMLRPFLRNGREEDRAAYDRAFAATFAIPEFRSIERSAAKEKARERLVTLLAQYRGVSEATATRLITNDLFLARLESDMTDEEARLQLENELFQVNAELLEEAASLEARLEREQREREQKEKHFEQLHAAHEAALEQEREERLALEREQATHQTTKLEAERDAHEATLRQQQAETETVLRRKDEELARQKREAQMRLQDIELQRQASEADHGRQIGELKSRLGTLEQQDAKRRELETRRLEVLAYWRNVAEATILSFLSVVAFLLLVSQAKLPFFVFIRQHPHSLGLQLAGIIAICCAVFAYKVVRYRAWCLIVGILSLCAGGLIQIL